MDKNESSDRSAVEDSKWESLRNLEREKLPNAPSRNEKSVQRPEVDIDQLSEDIDRIYAEIREKRAETLPREDDSREEPDEPVKKNTLRGFVRRLLGGEREKTPQYYSLVSEAKRAGGYYQKHMKANKKSYEALDRHAMQIPYEAGKIIESIVDDPDLLLGIHCSTQIDGANYKQDDILNAILRDGLRNYGDINSGAIHERPNISKTVTVVNNMHSAVDIFKKGRRFTDGSIILALPSKCFDANSEIKNEYFDTIYTKDSTGATCIRPEYIKGFLTRPDKGMAEFSTREEILASIKDKE